MTADGVINRMATGAQCQLLRAPSIRIAMRRLVAGRRSWHGWRRFSSSTAQPVRIAVVGSGPAGFYVAGSLLRQLPAATVDIFDKQPVPFGLVRFGVAPDHPEVKNCIHQFEQLFDKSDGRVNLFCNVAIGSDLTVEELRADYHAVVMAYGAERERRLGVPGEQAANCISGRSFVGWYNGLPQDRHLAIDFDTDTAIVIGHGNVALDCARVLLSPLDRLASTDLSDYALEALAKSRVERVILVGRRGPLQVSFTIKELRELVNLPGSTAIVESTDLEATRDIVASLPRPRRRLTELMLKAADAKLKSDQTKSWQLLFRRTPLQVLTAAERVSGARFGMNDLVDPLTEKARAVITDREETIQCGLILYSIGYQTIVLPGLPFNQSGHVIRTIDGCRVEDLPGVYATGWCARGPTGVIASTQAEAKATADLICADVESGALQRREDRPGTEGTKRRLMERRVQWISWDDWRRVDCTEREMGQVRGKPREKLTSVMDIVRVARGTGGSSADGGGGV
uniref:NADPH:adrenodoxin oxidoreductase, mitochondrial n=1 Tax=Plectus sambesii TaxID=2011161 RepID=A0A914W810_9BILA